MKKTSKHEGIRQQANDALRKYFHKQSFLPGQEKAVMDLLRHKDSLCLFPTGAGKSICFQLPAMLFSGVTMVISPLIALMNDQVRHLKEENIGAECLNSLQTPEERRRIMLETAAGRLKLLYVSPERLKMENFVREISQVQVDMVVVDEAHCIVQWGEEFRPSYTEIGVFISKLPHHPVICAMTATADMRMRMAIVNSLGMRNARFHVLPLIRENLTYRIVSTMGKNHAITEVIAEHPYEKGVIFCSTRLRCQEIAEYLTKQNLPISGASFYHAGLDRGERDRVQQQYTEGKCSILAATSAFGMGVDIPDIRYIIHDTFPEDMVDYVQQAGRAGRDGKPSECIVLMDVADMEKERHAIQRLRGSHEKSYFRRQIECSRRWRKQKETLHWAMSGECLQTGIMKVFSQRGTPCGRCSACLNHEKGSGFHQVPDLAHQSRQEVCLWALKWQRARIGKRLNQPAAMVIGDERLLKLSEGLLLKEGDTDSSFVRIRLNAVVNHMKDA